MNKKQSFITFIVILVIVHILVFTVGGFSIENQGRFAANIGFILGMEVMLLPISGIIFLIVYGIAKAIKNN